MNAREYRQYMADKDNEVRELKHELELTRLQVFNLKLQGERNKKKYNELEKLYAKENKDKRIAMVLAGFNLMMFVGVTVSVILWG